MVRNADAHRGSLIKQAAMEAKHAWTESGLFDHTCDKIILYTRTCKDADDLAELLDRDAYTAESGTPAEKKEILDRWIRTSNAPYVVATTALAEGSDYLHVRLVMNVDEPDSLIIFAQESGRAGRAGRDGKQAYSMVLLPLTWQARTTTTGQTYRLRATTKGIGRFESKKTSRPYIDICKACKANNAIGPH